MPPSWSRTSMPDNREIPKYPLPSPRQSPLSSRPELPDFFLRAAIRRVGLRSGGTAARSIMPVNISATQEVFKAGPPASHKSPITSHFFGGCHAQLPHPVRPAAAIMIWDPGNRGEMEGNRGQTRHSLQFIKLPKCGKRSVYPPVPRERFTNYCPTVTALSSAARNSFVSA